MKSALQNNPPAAHGHSSQSKEHRYLPIAIPLPITISRKKVCCLVINGLLFLSSIGFLGKRLEESRLTLHQPSAKKPSGCPDGFHYFFISLFLYFFFPFLSVLSFFRFWRIFFPLWPRALCSFFLVGLYMPGVTTFFFGFPCLTRRTFPFSS